ncbi:MAG: tetratricopeptide repeat protein [Deltaproteobacteria bacterium]
MTAGDAAETLILAGDWLAARRMLEIGLQAGPDDHWLRSRLGVTYYEMGDYPTALEHIAQAKALAPNCPIVLWGLAGTLQQMGRHETAAGLYGALVKRQAGWLAKETCLQSRALAKGLIADCHFRLSRSLGALGRKEEGDTAFLEHLDMRGPGCYSIYPLDKFPKRGTALRLWRQKKQKGRRVPAAQDRVH